VAAAGAGERDGSEPRRFRLLRQLCCGLGRCGVGVGVGLGLLRCELHWNQLLL